MHFWPVLCEPYVDKISPPSQRCKIKTLLSLWSTAVAVVCVLPFWEDRGQSWRCWLLHSRCCSRCPSRFCHGSCPLYPLHVCFWLSKQQAGDLWRAWRMDAGVFLSADSYQEPCSTDLDVSNLQNLHQYICDHGNIISKRTPHPEFIYLNPAVEMVSCFILPKPRPGPQLIDFLLNLLNFLSFEMMVMTTTMMMIVVVVV